ncbi:MAG: regulatory iron-sulfur-containing complex subunit RicT [Bacillota bacterium]
MSSDDLPVVETPAPETPRSVVVRYGYLRLIGEFPYDGDTRPLCGSRVVLRTRRGTELGEIITTTCAEYNCSRSISRDQLLTYIGNSGGTDYPFSNDGRVLRLATPEDVQEQARIEQEKPKYLTACQALVDEMQLPMKLVDVELLLGGEMATFFFLSENRVDFRNLVKQLAAQFHTRIQMHQVGARDEARLVADYETCGQHCCCRQFLKVLRPVNMGAAKMQKATLDPSKISGRCGRLKCCLRYEEATYDELRKRLPKVGTRVRTAEGEGVVEETMILTQLVRVRLDGDAERFVAVPVEELNRDPAESATPRPPRRTNAPEREAAPRNESAQASNAPAADPTSQQPPARQQDRRPRIEGRPDRSRRDRPRRDSRSTAAQTPNRPQPAQSAPPSPKPPVKPEPSQPSAQSSAPAPASPTDQPAQPGIGMLGRRRRRGRGRGREGREGTPPNPPNSAQ